MRIVHTTGACAGGWGGIGGGLRRVGAGRALKRVSEQRGVMQCARAERSTSASVSDGGGVGLGGPVVGGVAVVPTAAAALVAAVGAALVVRGGRGESLLESRGMMGYNPEKEDRKLKRSREKINFAKAPVLSQQHIEACRARRRQFEESLREGAEEGTLQSFDLNEIDIPDDHPFAEKRKETAEEKEERERKVAERRARAERRRNRNLVDSGGADAERYRRAAAEGRGLDRQGGMGRPSPRMQQRPPPGDDRNM